MDRWGGAGTIELLAKSLCTGGVILIGEPYWRQLPPTENVAKACHANAVIDFLILPELLASFGDLNYDVVEMVLADQEGWDDTRQPNGSLCDDGSKRTLTTTLQKKFEPS